MKFLSNNVNWSSKMELGFMGSRQGFGVGIKTATVRHPCAYFIIQKNIRSALNFACS